MLNSVSGAISGAVDGARQVAGKAKVAANMGGDLLRQGHATLLAKLPSQGRHSGRHSGGDGGDGDGDGDGNLLESMMVPPEEEAPSESETRASTSSVMGRARALSLSVANMSTTGGLRPVIYMPGTDGKRMYPRRGSNPHD